MFNRAFELLNPSGVPSDLLEQPEIPLGESVDLPLAEASREEIPVWLLGQRLNPTATILCRPQFGHLTALIYMSFNRPNMNAALSFPSASDKGWS